ncbi:hypothetical protein PanWU01x14_023030 [Parasponia andersonii]|uniref:Uncharacterized protein n=1 Tax=Parasponia andersonii TaxID=3476 RepID=A0A2P5DXE1_PARAD|nr:hypothetical protein PanWU01x14_023030 [Parasponia andersonii]
MREAGAKKLGCLPYGILLTKVFNHFEIPLHDESFKEAPMSPYDKVAIEHMYWYFDAKIGDWSYKGKNMHDKGDLDGNQEGGPSTTQEAPSSFNFEEAFQLMNARMDTLVEEFNAFKEG